MDKFRAALQLSAKRENIVFRRNASEGTWVSLLLPLAVIVGGWKSKSQFYISSTIYSFNLLLNTFHLYYHIYENESLYVTKRFNKLCIIPLCLTVFFYINNLHLDFKESLCYTVANALIYFEGLPFILKVFPSSFSFGESNLVIQGLSLFLYSTFTRLNKVILGSILNDEYNTCTTILQLGHAGILFMCIVPFTFKKMRNPLIMYIWMSFIVFGFILMSAYYALGENPVLWLWSFFTIKDRVSVVFLWLICCVISGIICMHRITTKKQADTVNRKYFHVLADIVFITGVIYDINLIYFASGCALAFLVLLEIFRLMKIPPLYEFLQDTFILYVDEKDSGTIALTALYLLIGYSIPLWLHPLKVYSARDYLPLLSGVLSVGIGDTCASIGGKIFGKHRWKDSKKTIEGTMACACSQVLFVFMLQQFGYILPSKSESLKILLSIIISSFVEAFTDQIDNIVLPVITYILLIL